VAGIFGIVLEDVTFVRSPPGLRGESYGRLLGAGDPGDGGRLTWGARRDRFGGAIGPGEGGCPAEIEIVVALLAVRA